jgi:hypothetical protein
VKPEDQGTFFQDFWAYPVTFAPLVDSIPTLLCSVPEMLRTTMKPNGWRYAPSGYWWVGRDNAILTEPTRSHKTCLKTRREASYQSGARCVSPQMRHCSLIMNKAEQVQY